jgi:transcriptional regulator with XRE-family HTH domain
VIGSRLKAWRHALGLTQSAFAERIGVHIGVLKKYEQGLNVPGGEALAAIAKTSVNMTWLLTGEGEMRPQTEHIETAAMSRKAASDGLLTAIGPAMPICPEEDSAALAVRQPRRWQAIIALVEAIDDDGKRDAILNELFSRAQEVAELADMRRQLAEIKKRAG